MSIANDNYQCIIDPQIQKFWGGRTMTLRDLELCKALRWISCSEQGGTRFWKANDFIVGFDGSVHTGSEVTDCRYDDRVEVQMTSLASAPLEKFFEGSLLQEKEEDTFALYFLLQAIELEFTGYAKHFTGPCRLTFHAIR